MNFVSGWYILYDIINIMERSEAIRLNVNKYDNGRPCKRGHFGYRYTKDGGCCKCSNDASWRYSKKLSKLRKSADHFTKEVFVETTRADYEILMIIAQTYIKRYRPEYEKLNLNKMEISTNPAKFIIPRRNVNQFINIANFLRSMSWNEVKL